MRDKLSKKSFINLLNSIMDLYEIDDMLDKQGYRIDCELRDDLFAVIASLAQQLATMLCLKNTDSTLDSISWWLEGWRSGEPYKAKAPGETRYKVIKTPEMLWNFMVKCGEIKND